LVTFCFVDGRSVPPSYCFFRSRQGRLGRAITARCDPYVLRSRQLRRSPSSSSIVSRTFNARSRKSAATVPIVATAVPFKNRSRRFVTGVSVTDQGGGPVRHAKSTNRYHESLPSKRRRVRSLNCPLSLLSRPRRVGKTLSTIKHKPLNNTLLPLAKAPLPGITIPALVDRICLFTRGMRGRNVLDLWRRRLDENPGKRYFEDRVWWCTLPEGGGRGRLVVVSFRRAVPARDRIRVGHISRVRNAINNYTVTRECVCWPPPPSSSSSSYTTRPSGRRIFYFNDGGVFAFFTYPSAVVW